MLGDVFHNRCFIVNQNIPKHKRTTVNARTNAVKGSRNFNCPAWVDTTSQPDRELGGLSWLPLSSRPVIRLDAPMPIERIAMQTVFTYDVKKSAFLSKTIPKIARSMTPREKYRPARMMCKTRGVTTALRSDLPTESVLHSE